jgi:hypothetical protein
MKRRIALICLYAILAAGCTSERAGPEACREILDRLVELELREKGFRDAALEEQRKVEYRRLLAPELRQCEDLHIPPGAMACVRQAKTAEALSHECLRSSP